jgi:hypothetical protein
MGKENSSSIQSRYIIFGPVNMVKQDFRKGESKLYKTKWESSG